ncbi:MAG: cation transporter [Dehalococcoidales bacterium]|nr:cation transporter [Dehalococcoidales bacterium]
MFSGRSGAAKLSIIIVIVLIGLKVAVGVITGSLSVLAQAADSFLDLFAISVTFLAIRIAARPADEEHPFGHGKAENVAAIIQAILIFIAGGSIIYSAVRRIQTDAVLEMTEAGIVVMAVSIIASIFLSRYLLRVAKREDSMALEANAHNIAADVYSAAAVFVGLIAVRLTGLGIIDSVLAGLVALFILKVAFNVLRHSFGGLVDTKLPESEENNIRAAITEHFGGEVVSFHKLRTRKAGRQRYIDLHLVMPKHVSIEEAHNMCNHLEIDIKVRLVHTDVTIHVEPCDDNCDACDLTCEERKK